MEEEIQIINQNTRREKFKNFVIKNKKILVTSVSSIIIIILLSFFRTFGDQLIIETNLFHHWETFLIISIASFKL